MINMRERRYVKFRVDMFEDTKFKIIDMKPERDLIHYVWTRLVTLAGKVNLEGELYLSKKIPYTIETLAIEFNRDINQIKFALDAFVFNVKDISGSFS
jgi:predicted phage replisome organizer